MPEGDFTLPLSQARVVAVGTDITLVAWGQQVGVLRKAVRGNPESADMSSFSQKRWDG